MHLRHCTNAHLHNDTIYMSETKEDGSASQSEPKRIRLTVQLTTDAYHAISDLQRNHRSTTGKALPAWQVIDKAIVAYAKRQSIKAGK
jgi:hypothetical protein